MFALQLWVLADISVASLGKKVMRIVDFFSSPFKPNIANLKLIIGDTTFQGKYRIHKGFVVKSKSPWNYFWPSSLLKTQSFKTIANNSQDPNRTKTTYSFCLEQT